jgi:hypothetical protein
MLVELLINDINEIIDITSSIPLEYGIEDELFFKKSIHSLSINILGTPDVIRIFNHIQHNNIVSSTGTTTFDIRKRHGCKLLIDGSIFITGFFILKNIKVKKFTINDQVIFTIVFYDDLIDFFEVMGDKKLKDLDILTTGFISPCIQDGYTLGTYQPATMNFNYEEIKENLESDVDQRKVFKFCLANYNYNQKLTNDKWPYNAISLDNVYPVFYAKAIFNAILETYNMYYYSQVLSNIGNTHDNMMNHIVLVPNNSINLTNTSVLRYWADPISLVGAGTDWIRNFYRKNEWFSGQTYNYYELDDFYYSGFTTDQSSIRVPEDGFYNINMYIDINFTYNSLATKFYLYKNDEIIHEYLIYYIGSGETIITPDPIELKEGDFLSIKVENGYDGGGIGTITWNKFGMELIYVKDGEDMLGKDIELKDYLPDMTQSDFVRNFMKLFNLKILYRDWGNSSSQIGGYETTSNYSFIDVYENFYTYPSIPNQSLNIKDTLIENEPITIIPVKEIKQVKYSEGDDYYSKLYKDTYDEVYGNKVLDYSDYLINIKTDEVEFQTCQWYIKETEGIKIKIPALMKDLDVYFFDKKESGTPLIQFIEKIDFPVGFNATRMRLSAPLQPNSILSSVSIFSHIKNIGGWWYDLNFETSNPLSTGITSIHYDQKTLYDTFWEKQISNLIHQDTRIIEIYCYFSVNDMNIKTLNLNKLVEYDNCFWFILNLNYDPFSYKHKVKLLKLSIPLKDIVWSGELDYLLKNSTDYILTNTGTTENYRIII